MEGSFADTKNMQFMLVDKVGDLLQLVSGFSIWTQQAHAAVPMPHIYGSVPGILITMNSFGRFVSIVCGFTKA